MMWRDTSLFLVDVRMAKFKFQRAFQSESPHMNQDHLQKTRGTDCVLRLNQIKVVPSRIIKNLSRLIRP